MLLIYGNRKIQIDQALLREKFIHSSGPGGQNVNKVATAVQLRFDLGSCNSFDESEKQKIRKAAGYRLTQEDIIVIDSRNHRRRERNREEALERLKEILLEGFRIQSPRFATRPGKGAVEKRLQSKKKDKLRKQLRKKVDTGGRYE